jgi:hypothetical protein
MAAVTDDEEGPALYVEYLATAAPMTCPRGLVATTPTELAGRAHTNKPKARRRLAFSNPTAT